MHIFYFARAHCQWLAASLVLLQRYALKKEKQIEHARLLVPKFSKDTKSLSPSAPAKISIFIHPKMFEYTVQKELEDSLSEYEIAAGRNGRDRWSDAVRDVICDVTPPDLDFWGPEWKQKTAFVLGRIRRIPGSCHQAVRGNCGKMALRTIARSARRPRSGCPRPSRSAPGQIVCPPAFRVQVPSFILSVA